MSEHAATSSGSALAVAEMDGRAAKTPREATVGVVITTYNHAHFLGEALESVARQTHASATVVVVDDGSTDDPARVVARFPAVRLIRQDNRGLAAARNAGLAAMNTTFVVFLDADDRLRPGAIEAGLACFARVPESGFVYGGHYYIDASGGQIGQRFEPPGEEPFLHLLRRNFVAMHGTVMYHTDRLRAVGGFDERLRRCEDYDVYFRMAQRHPITGYPDLVADYRMHADNMSANHLAMLRSALQVHARYAPSWRVGSGARKAWRAGRRHWRRCYAEEMAAARYRQRQHGASLWRSLPALGRIAVGAPEVALEQTLGGIRRRIAMLLPTELRTRLLKGREYVPRVGAVRFGDLRRTRPISSRFGFDRGLPVDRHYVEYFLSRHASEIRGRVLEIGDNVYTSKFGGSRVTRSDVLHVSGNPVATFVGELTDLRVLPEQAFDCIILTQTLQLIYDVALAVRRIHRALAPGGVVLVTAPGISQLDGGEWGKTWFWSFTPLALERLFGDVFGADDLHVEHYGNVFAATAFLHGLAVADVETSDLDPIDPAYPVIIAVRARKRER